MDTNLTVLEAACLTHAALSLEELVATRSLSTKSPQATGYKRRRGRESRARISYKRLCLGRFLLMCTEKITNLVLSILTTPTAFPKLSPFALVLALTAASSKESSYGTFCEPKDDLDTCLADEFSYGWMIAATDNDVRTFTVDDLYNTVKDQILSHAMMYGDKSDIYHAYHVLLDHGFNMNNVITMAYDDIAHNEENPHPGEVYNDYSYTDVYKGVKIDYSGEDVSPANFLNALKGNASDNKKVLNSTENDEILVFYSDHGGPNLIAFLDDDLYSEDLITTLKTMHQQKRYKRMLLLIEACYSGSMFEDLLPNNINILAITAANKSESSYGTFCRPKDDMHTCLADEFSYNWMMAATNHDVRNFTVKQMYDEVKDKIRSHEMMYGDLSIAKLPLSEFISKTKNYSPGNSKVQNTFCGAMLLVVLLVEHIF
ncbi:unnamed protein product [Calicophoron daubneyi]|uniref:Legumain n=1 Tax=Calicophoron daubneyi TaxID=300641 RepID=A0AAV2T6E6_CALDB